jgi:dihydroorotate dehydrogenase
VPFALYAIVGLFHAYSMDDAVARAVGGIYQKALKPLLFRCDPETVHDWFIAGGERLGRWAWARFLATRLLRYDHSALTQTICGTRFVNPVGLAAGFDKNGRLVGMLKAVGFGFAEVGTVTWQPYGGNPPPRLYRLPKSGGIIVNFGLKNDGITAVLQRLRQQPRPENFPLSISIGTTNSRETVTAAAGIEDYCRSLSAAAGSGLGDLYTINISCPNTFGGEQFTTPPILDWLLEALYRVECDKPIFLKMPINLPWEQFHTLLAVASSHGIDGVVIGNLNKDRHDPHILDSIPARVKGGISGKPTWQLSNALISKTYREYGGRLVIVGVGGIFSARDAYEKIRRGASLVQLITGMIFRGPQLVGEINRGLVQLLRRDGYRHISEAIGADHRPAAAALSIRSRG